MDHPPEHQNRTEAKTRLIETSWWKLLAAAAIPVYVTLVAAEKWPWLVVPALLFVAGIQFLRRTNLRRSRPRPRGRGGECEAARQDLADRARQQLVLVAMLAVWAACAWADVPGARMLGLPVAGILAGLGLWVEWQAGKLTKRCGFPLWVLPWRVKRNQRVPAADFPVPYYIALVLSLIFVVGAGNAATASRIDAVPTAKDVYEAAFGDGGDEEDEKDQVKPGPHHDAEPTPTSAPSPTEPPEETSTPTPAPSPTATGDCSAETAGRLEAEAEDPAVGLEMSDDYEYVGDGEVGCLTSAGVVQEGRISYGILTGGESDPSMVVGTLKHGASVIFAQAYERTLRYIRLHDLRYVTDRIDVGPGDFYLYLLEDDRCSLSAREYKGDSYVDLPPIVSKLATKLGRQRDKFPVPQGIEPTGSQVRYSFEFRDATPALDELETIVLEGGTASWTDASGERHEVTEPKGCRNHSELERLAREVPPP